MDPKNSCVIDKADRDKVGQTFGLDTGCSAWRKVAGNLATLLTKAVGTQRQIVKNIFGVGHFLSKKTNSNVTGILKYAKGMTNALPYLNES